MARAAMLLLLTLTATALPACRFDAKGLPRRAAVDGGGGEGMLFPDAAPPDAGRDVTLIPLPDLSGDLGCPSLFKCNSDKKKSLICVAGAYRERDCARGCDEASGLCRAFAASNEAGTAMHFGFDKLIVADGTTLTVDTTACSATGLKPGAFTAAPQPGLRCLLVVGELLIEPKGILRAAGKRPLLIAASGAVTVKGLIDVGGRGNAPGPGGEPGGKPGSFPVSTVAAAPEKGEGSGCGGGGVGHTNTLEGITGGAGGSNGTAGANGGGIDNALGAYPKPASNCDKPCAYVIHTGSGGGAGSNSTPLGGAGAGGGGGGGLQITSLHSITVEGQLNAGGGGGQGGSAAVGSGGGGGSGGGVLLESWELNATAGGSLVAVNGGGGGGGSLATDTGEAGADGQAAAIPGKGGAGGVADFGLLGKLICGSGGDGAADALSAMPGGRSSSAVEPGGGGGGGAGRICVRVAADRLDLAQKGKFSPAAGSPSVTILDLAK